MRAQQILLDQRIGLKHGAGGRAMRALIEDMTNMNMLRVGSAEVAASRQALQPILESAYEEMRPLIEAKGQQVTRHVPSEQLLASVDAPKLTMALTNLLNNAMRFTPGGGRIEIGLERHGADAKVIVLPYARYQLPANMVRMDAAPLRYPEEALVH